MAAFAAIRPGRRRCASKRWRRWAYGPSPSPMDRVDGIYIGQAKPRDARRGTGRGSRLMQSASEEDAPADEVALAEAAGRLDAQGAAPVLLTQLRSDTSSNVRVAALKALQALKVPNMDEVMKVAVADSDANVRRAALGILPSLSIERRRESREPHRGDPRRRRQRSAGRIRSARDAEERRRRKSARILLRRAGRRQACAAVQLDLVDAMQANGSPAPCRAARRLSRNRSRRRQPVLAFRDALLQGGSVERGRETFVENPAAQCTRCHTVRNAGSDVGPNLTGVATRLTRDQILESLLEPSARIAAGYGTVGSRSRTASAWTARCGTRRPLTSSSWPAHRRPSSGSRSRRLPTGRTRSPPCRRSE